MTLTEELQRTAVVAEAMTWLGTPYHHHGAVKGVGVDCAHLLSEVFTACGLLPKLDLGNYPREWHLHHGDELFLGWLERLGARPVDVPQPGDLAVYRFGRCFAHGAIVVELDAVVHSYLDRGVIYTRAGEDPLDGRPVKHYTFVGVQHGR